MICLEVEGLVGLSHRRRSLQKRARTERVTSNQFQKWQARVYRSLFPPGNEQTFFFFFTSSQLFLSTTSVAPSTTFHLCGTTAHIVNSALLPQLPCIKRRAPQTPTGFALRFAPDDSTLDSMDDQEYLEPDWDPASVTIPRLRAILVAHNISYPASAKKAALIEIFNTSVLPQARKIRAQNARVKRTSRGIEDITTGRKGTGARDDDDESESAPTPASIRSTRRSTRSRTEEPLEVPEPTPRSIRHSTAPPQSVPRASSKHARQSEPLREEDEEPTPKRTAPRRSMATPAMKTEPADDSPFSNNNVFQRSGNTPPEPRAVDHERRRTIMSSARDLERRNRELRRRTDGVSQLKAQTDGAVVPTRRTFHVPVKSDDVQPSEEFTPNEQLEMAQAEETGQLVPVRRQKTGPGANAKFSIFVVLAALFCGPAALWRQEKLEVGYCGIGHPSAEIGGINVPEWAESVRPACEPCPQHAYCTELLHTECEPGFVLTQHPLSLNGLIPIPPTCEPDSAKARKVNAVKERAVEALRKQNAKYECGEAAAPQLQETALKQAISTKRRKGMSNVEFEDLWSSAMGDISKSDEIVSGSDG